MKISLKKLYNFSQLLSQNNIKHWLDWGSLLHAYRDKKLKHDDEDDIDLGLLRQDWDKVKQVFEENDIEFADNKISAPIKFIDKHKKKKINMSYCTSKLDRAQARLKFVDLYFWDLNPTVSSLPKTISYEKYGKLRQEIMDTPRSALFCWGVDTEKPNRYLRQTKKYFIQELDKLSVNGYSFPIPRYVEKFLLYRYGAQWQLSMTKGQHNKYVKDGLEEEDFIKEDKITVLVEGTWDLFHQGHVELLKRAHDIYDKVIVGVASDDLIRSYKRDPIIPYDDRVKILQACKYVDEIYHNAPCLNITEKVLDQCGADYGLHSVDDPNNWKVELKEIARYDQSLIDNGRAHFLSYTGYHSSDIIDKILKPNK